MSNLWKRKWPLRMPLRNDHGGVMIEFGFAMPFLVFLMLGGIELGRYVLLHQKLDRTAMTVSDLVARVATTDSGEIDNVLNAANLVMAPFDLSTSGRVFISSVFQNSSGDPEIDWQRSGAGTLSVASDVGTAGGPAAISDNDLVSPTSGIIIGETYFEYSPWFITLIPTTTIRHVAIFSPRLSATVTCSTC